MATSKVLPVKREEGRKERKFSLTMQTIFHKKKDVSDRSNLNPDKFNSLMNYVAVDFQESAICFLEHTKKFKDLLDVEACQLFLVDKERHQLYTFFSDKSGQDLRVFKPMDRGLGSEVIDKMKGLIVENVQQSPRWDKKVDELPNFTTFSYLAWPLRSQSDECVGLIEARNKINKSRFDISDEQMAQIYAHQISAAISQYKQNELLADRNDAFRKAYEKNFDKSEAITIGNRKTSINGKARQFLSESLKLAAAELGVPQSKIGEIKRWDLNVFSKSVEELEMLVVDVFEDRGLFSRFYIDIKVFLSFVKEVVAGYNDTTPYHNHHHAFDVMHVCYLFISTCDAESFLEDFNVLTLLVGALAHDAGHDGLNNAFHATTMSELAITYNSISIMENYSTAFLFRVLKKHECNIFKNIDESEVKKLRSRLIDMILDTDAKNHFTLMTRFKHGLEMKQLSRGLLSSMILHISDVSNPVRPNHIACLWAIAVQDEFFRQGDKEKELGLPCSPFMDRSYENLPRMQGAFIDAVVSPVFQLTAEFLPEITEKCVKNLQINRAFWNNLQNKQIIKTKDVIKEFSERDDGDGDNSVRRWSNVQLRPEDSDRDDQPDQERTAIPGIPQNAPATPKERRLSLIDMTSGLDESLAAARLRRETENIKKLEVKKIFSFRDQNSAERKKRIAAILDGNVVQLIMLFCTVYALIADDLSLWVGDKANDGALSVITFIVLILFTFELFVSMYCVPDYMAFFFWLDLVAALSLIPEIGFLVGEDEFSNSNNDFDTLGEHGTLTRAGRAAKAGARAGRLARVLRLIRLVRIIKLLKWVVSYVKKRMKHQAQGKVVDSEEEVEFQMSNVGRTMTESITKKVILGVIFMLLTFSMFQDLPTPDARVWQIDDLAIQTGDVRTQLRKNYIERYSARIDSNPSVLFKLVGVDEEYADLNTYKNLRTIEIEKVIAPSNSSIYALFDISSETQNTAMQSFIMTIVVTLLLATLSMLFSKDAYNIMIRPIEKMKHTVQKLSENPFLHLEKLKNAEEEGGDNNVENENETDMLEAAITKMARLLQIGFGSAGAEIIANNLSDGGELNPMVPGSKVEGIFGFCDIREFTFATEGLQQDVMLFVNKIAEITHKYVVQSGGAPNKNIGDAFLLVWKLTDLEDGMVGLHKEVFDSALVSFLKIISDISNMGNLAAFLEGADENAAWRSSLEDFHVKMGFGLHTGWAIEGSIGSKVKVDASYLSPHVNLASRLEAATKQYEVPLLMSEAFVNGLRGNTQNKCRRVDSVTFKGSNEPMKIFHFDSIAFEHLCRESERVNRLLKRCTWEKHEAESLNIDSNEFEDMCKSGKDHLIKQVYEGGFGYYVNGEWSKAKIILSIWLKNFPGDSVGIILLERLCEANFVAPADWAGYHSLTEK